MEKYCLHLNILKWAGGRMHTPHPTLLDPTLAIIYRNHQKSLAYFIHLEPSVLFIFTKESQKGSHCTMPSPPKYARAGNS